MLVKDRMTPNPICGSPDMHVTEVKNLMKEKNFRHMPILDEGGNLVGLVTQRSLLRALPSDVTGFSRFEIDYLLAKTKAKDVMRSVVKTIDDNFSIEESARIMADEKIGCLPVCNGEELVGIITDHDLFGIMVDLMGGRRKGVRMTVLMTDRAGMVSKLTAAIAAEGGNMTVFWGYPGPEPETWISVAKVAKLDQEQLESIVSGLVDTTILDIRETSG